MSVWYYMKDGEQVGPIDVAHLKALATNGTLQPTDLIWKEGLPEWVQAGRTKGLFAAEAPVARVATAAAPARTVHAARPTVAAHATHAQPTHTHAARAPETADQAAEAPGEHHEDSTPATVGYYSGSGEIPARAAETLRHFQPRTGPTDEWPLNDQQLRQLQKAGKVRQLLVLLSSYFLLTAISGALVCLYVVIFIFTIGGISPRGLSLPTEGWISLVLLFGSTVAAWIAWRPTRRAKIWAPYTMLAVYGALILYGFYGLYQVMSTMGGLNGEALLLGVLPMLMVEAWLFAVAYFCFRATIIIPKFLAHPAWCQETLVNSYF